MPIKRETIYKKNFVRIIKFVHVATRKLTLIIKCKCKFNMHLRARKKELRLATRLT